MKKNESPKHQIVFDLNMMHLKNVSLIIIELFLSRILVENKTGISVGFLKTNFVSVFWRYFVEMGTKIYKMTYIMSNIF